MDEENKVEELKPEETKVEDIKVSEKAAACKKKMCDTWEKNKSTIIGVVLMLMLVVGSVAYKQYFKNNKSDIGMEGAKAKVEQFIKDNTPDGGAGITVKEVVKDSGLYRVTIDANKQEIATYITQDGSKFFPQPAVDLNAKADDSAAKTPATPEKTEAENKSDVPTVDLFVMSYCPYGLQMERGVLPAVEALGSKIKFNLKFVDYTLHGQKEVDENVNQYCVQKVAPTKLSKYLQCFWKDSKLADTSAAATSCMKSTGINTAQVTSCVAEAKKQFNPTDKAMGLNKEEAVKFGVQGSPTLVINGTTVSSSRDSASVLKAICSGFKTQPKECQAKLSTTSPAAGFTDEALAGGASAAACGN